MAEEERSPCRTCERLSKTKNKCAESCEFSLALCWAGRNGLATARRETSGLGSFVLNQVRSFDPNCLWCS